VSPVAVLLPVGAGFGYACGAIAIKRALGSGATGGWVNLLCNLLMALLFQLLWLLPGKPINFSGFLAAGTCGFLFFLGQIFTFRAIATGDVSVATPMLGTKVILVALFSSFLFGVSLPRAWWFASALASVGIALISYSPGGSHRHVVQAIAWSLAAAAVFALTDVMVQRWVPTVGYSRFAPLMFGSMGLLSMGYLPGLLRGILGGGATVGAFDGCSGKALPWLNLGGVLLAVQALAMYSAIGLFGSAALTNILYGSRCLWSVLLVWILGRVAGAASGEEGRALVMARRFAGALILLAAMALVLR